VRLLSRRAKANSSSCGRDGVLKDGKALFLLQR